MARGRGYRRRRRGRFSFLFKLLSFFVITGAVFAALTLFFRVESVEVTGNRRYSEEDVVAASGVELKQNLYFINKFSVKQRIFDRLPYVEEIAINRRLPDTLRIEIRESRVAAAIESADGLWLISEQGKLLEKSEAAPGLCPLVTGVDSLLEPAQGETLAFPENESYRAGVLLTLLQEAGERGMRDNIGVIRMDDDVALSFIYLDRFTVRQPWNAEIAYKLESLATVVDYLEANETGTIDLMTDGKASFIPT